MSFYTPKFDDCIGCKFFNRNIQQPTCKRCNAGEYFEEKIDDRAPDEHELMAILAGMENDD